MSITKYFVAGVTISVTIEEISNLVSNPRKYTTLAKLLSKQTHFFEEFPPP